MLTIQPLQSKRFTQVENLEVSEQQIGFVEPMTQILKHLSQHVHGHVIMLGQDPIGFFLIDKDYLKQYDFCEPASIGLRSFFIDKRYQGHGYGKKAVLLLRSYLNHIYGSYNYVYLTVNCKNPIAKRCYEQGAFVDTQELYHGGDFGPQHIMKLPLKVQQT